MKHAGRRRMAGAGMIVAATLAVGAGMAGAGSAVAAGPAIAVSAPVQELPSTGRIPAAAGAQKAIYSTNWSGYGKAGSYHAVSGTWTVPTVSMHGATNGFSSNWVGIGACGTACGGEKTLIQAGTEQDATSGGKLYRAWYELLPNAEIPVKMTVRPGDTMTVSINETATNQWQIVIRDVTRGATVTVNKHYVSHHRSVEWVEEATTVYYPGSQPFVSFPNLSRTTFRQLTANGAAANISSGSLKFFMLTKDGRTSLATPSAPKTGGTSFAVCSYKASCS
jgi:hypothetical protein